MKSVKTIDSFWVAFFLSVYGLDEAGAAGQSSASHQIPSDLFSSASSDSNSSSSYRLMGSVSIQPSLAAPAPDPDAARLGQFDNLSGTTQFIVPGFPTHVDYLAITNGVTIDLDAVGLNATTTFAPGGEVVLLRVQLTGNGRSTLDSIGVLIHDLSTLTGISASAISQFRLYKSADNTFGGDTQIGSKSAAALVLGQRFEVPVTDANNRIVPASGQYYFVTALLSTTQIDQTSFRPAFPAGGISVSFGALGSAIAPDDANLATLNVVATRLAFSTSPTDTSAVNGNTLSGKIFSTQPVVAFQDANGNVDKSVNGEVVTLALNSGSGVFAGTPTATAATGLATFTNLKYSIGGAEADKANFTLSAVDDGDVGGLNLTDVVSGAISADVVRTRLVVQIPASVSADNSFSVTLSAQDADAKVDVDYVGARTINWIYNNGTANGPVTGSRTLPANGPQTFAAGSVTVAGFQLVNTDNNGVTTLTADNQTDASIDGTSAALTVTPGSLARLVAQAATGQVKPGTTETITIRKADQFGNGVSTNLSGIGVVLSGGGGGKLDIVSHTFTSTHDVSGSNDTLLASATINASSSTATMVVTTTSLGTGVPITVTPSHGSLNNPVAAQVNVVSDVAGLSYGDSVSTTSAVSSLGNATPGTLVFNFVVHDSTAQSTYPTLIDGLSIPLTLNNVDLSDIAGVRISAVDNAGTKTWTTGTDANIQLTSTGGNAAFIRLGTSVPSIVDNPGVADVDTVANGGTLKFYVRIWFSSAAGALTDGGTITLALSGTNLKADFQTLSDGISTTSQVSNATATINVLATQLVFTQQPSGSLSGGAITPSLAVEARDANNNKDSNWGTQISLSATPGSTGGGNAGNPVNGAVTFPGVTYNPTADNQPFTLTASSPGLASATSNPGTSNVVTNNFGVRSSPGSVESGQSFTVAVEARWGSILDVNDCASINLSGGGINSTASTSGGVATFTHSLTANTDHQTVNLTASGCGTSVSVPSISINITANALATINDLRSPVFRSGDSDTVSVRAHRNGITDTDVNDLMSLVGPLGINLSARASEGIATFTNVSLTADFDRQSVALTYDDEPGGSGGDIGAGTTSTTEVDIVATKLIFVTKPDSSVSGRKLRIQPEVEAQDSSGKLDLNFVDIVTLMEDARGTISGNTSAALKGVATFTALTYVATGDRESFALTADDEEESGGEGNLPAVSAPPVISDVVATKLVFKVPPTSSVSDSALVPQPIIEAQDSSGTLDTDFLDSITISRRSVTGALRDSAVVAVSGVATFRSLAYLASADKQSFSLAADDLSGGAEGNLPAVNTTPINSDVKATKLAFVTEPDSSVSGKELKIQPVLIARNNRNIPDLDPHEVMAHKTSETKGDLVGDTTATTGNNGEAAFTDLRYDATVDKESFTLRFTSSGLAETTASPVISDVVATKLVFKVPPTSSVSDSALVPQPVVEAQDSNGTLDTDFSDRVTISRKSGTGALRDSAVVAESGVARFRSLTYLASVDKQSFSLAADDLPGGAAGNLPAVSITTIDSDVKATKLAFVTKPDSSVSGRELRIQPVLITRNNRNIPDLDPHEVMAHKTSETKGDLRGDTTATTTGSKGEAAFADLRYDATVDRESFTLRFTSPGLADTTAPPVVSDVVATKLVFKTQPNNKVVVTYGNLVNDSLAIEAQDERDLLDQGYNDPVSLIAVANEGSSQSVGTLTGESNQKAASGGRATWSDSLKFGEKRPFRLRAASEALTPDFSDEVETISSLTGLSSTMAVRVDSSKNEYANVGDSLDISLKVGESALAYDAGERVNSVIVDLRAYGNDIFSFEVGGAGEPARNGDTVEWEFKHQVRIADAGANGIDVSAATDSAQITFEVKDSDEDTLSTTVQVENAVKGVDTKVPQFDSNMVVVTQVAPGTDGKYKVGTVFNAAWEPPGTDSDIDTVRIDLTGFGGNREQRMTRSGIKYSTEYTVVAGTIDTVGVNPLVAVTDDAGNITQATMPLEALVDNEAPRVTGSNISHVGVDSLGTNDTYKIGTSFRVQWKHAAGGDQNSDIAKVTADVSDFEQATGVLMDNTEGVYTAPLVKIVSGTIDSDTAWVRLTATDDAGNTGSNVPADNNVPPENRKKVDNIPPQGPVTTEGATGVDTVFIAGDIVNIIWTGNPDGNTGIAEIASSSGTRDTTLALEGEGTLQKVVPGNLMSNNNGVAYKIHLRVTDNAGNTLVDSVKEFIVDNVAPEGVLKEIGTVFTKADSITLNLTVDDKRSPADVSRLGRAYLWAGMPRSGTLSAVDSLELPDSGAGIVNAAFSFDFNQGDGSYLFAVSARDQAGNSEPIPLAAEDSIIVDRQPPKINKVKITSDNAERSRIDSTTNTIWFNSRAGEGEGQKIQLSVAWKDANIDSIWVERNDSKDKSLFSIVTPIDTAGVDSLSHPVSPTDTSSQTYNVVAIDKARNRNSEVREVVLIPDNIPPTLEGGWESLSDTVDSLGGTGAEDQGRLLLRDGVLWFSDLANSDEATLAGTASDASSGLKTISISGGFDRSLGQNDSTRIDINSAAADTAWMHTFAVTSEAVGPDSVIVRAVDFCGNEASRKIDMREDNQPPPIPTELKLMEGGQVTDGWLDTTDVTVNFRHPGVDASDGVGFSHFEALKAGGLSRDSSGRIDLGSGEIQKNAPGDFPSSTGSTFGDSLYSVNLTGEEGGTEKNQFWILAGDALGNRSFDSTSVGIDLTPPRADEVVVVDSLLSELHNNAEIAIPYRQGTGDNLSGIESIRVAYRFTKASIFATETNAGSWDTSAAWQPLTPDSSIVFNATSLSQEGIHELAVLARDRAGNVEVFNGTSEAEIVYDKSPPQVTDVSLTDSVISATGLAGVDSITTIRFSATDSISGLDITSFSSFELIGPNPDTTAVKIGTSVFSKQSNGSSLVPSDTVGQVDYEDLLKADSLNLKSGEYRMRYTLTDRTGNATTATTAPVLWIDSEAPRVVDSLLISNNNRLFADPLLRTLEPQDSAVFSPNADSVKDSLFVRLGVQDTVSASGDPRNSILKYTINTIADSSVLLEKLFASADTLKWTWDGKAQRGTAVYQEGIDSLSIAIRDEAGNTTAVRGQFEIDTTPPNVAQEEYFDGDRHYTVLFSERLDSTTLPAAFDTLIIQGIGYGDTIDVVSAENIPEGEIIADAAKPEDQAEYYRLSENDTLVATTTEVKVIPKSERGNIEQAVPVSYNGKDQASPNGLAVRRVFLPVILEAEIFNPKIAVGRMDSVVIPVGDSAPPIIQRMLPVGNRFGVQQGGLYWKGLLLEPAKVSQVRDLAGNPLREFSRPLDPAVAGIALPRIDKPLIFGRYKPPEVRLTQGVTAQFAGSSTGQTAQTEGTTQKEGEVVPPEQETQSVETLGTGGIVPDDVVNLGAAPVGTPDTEPKKQQQEEQKAIQQTEVVAFDPAGGVLGVRRVAETPATGTGGTGGGTTEPSVTSKKTVVSLTISTPDSVKFRGRWSLASASQNILASTSFLTGGVTKLNWVNDPEAGGSPKVVANKVVAAGKEGYIETKLGDSDDIVSTLTIYRALPDPQDPANFFAVAHSRIILDNSPPEIGNLQPRLGMETTPSPQISAFVVDPRFGTAGIDTSRLSIILERADSTKLTELTGQIQGGVSPDTNKVLIALIEEAFPATAPKDTLLAKLSAEIFQYRTPVLKPSKVEETQKAQKIQANLVFAVPGQFRDNTKARRSSNIENEGQNLRPGMYRMKLQIFDRLQNSFSQTVFFQVVDETVGAFVNYPNPFNYDGSGTNYGSLGNEVAGTTIRFVLGKPFDTATIRIYDLAGNMVRKFDSEEILSAQEGVAFNTFGRGEYKVHWDGRSQFGEELANGIYLGELELDSKRYYTKMAIFRK